MHILIDMFCICVQFSTGFISYLLFFLLRFLPEPLAFVLKFLWERLERRYVVSDGRFDLLGRFRIGLLWAFVRICVQ